MSTSEEDRIARSVALEKTYVHDVYDHMSALQYPEHRNTTPWPKLKRFLNDLEPGSLVCDVGCGNGKYLKVNPSIFKVGSDRCRKLTQIAKDDDNEVILCDNLTLPFRDESFDAVLSIAVIHHFATKERRVGALRELARVLRIGGRLMITVWAMEQKDRKFESQDVLVQWHHPQFYHSPSLEFLTTTTATSEEEFLLPCHISQGRHTFDDSESLCSRSNSLRQDGRPGRSRLRLFQSLRSFKTSPSSSSLSSPNTDTCYAFVKKALQKLSRSSKKEKHNPRTWFTESWAAYGRDDHLPATRYDPEGCEEDSSVQDLPIELRRMEKEGETYRLNRNAAPRQSLTVNLIQKSRSLNDILSQSQLQSSLVEPSPITRSRSSLVTIDGQKIKIKTTDLQLSEVTVDMLKPKLVKQKKSICDERLDVDEDEERDIATDMKKLVKELPMFSISLEKPERNNVLKQKSLTEEIMSADRLREKEKVRQNIQKQASLNEELIYRRQKALDSLRDSFLMSSSKKFQMFRSGLTSKLKNSTTNIEKVTGASIKSGFAKIFQGLTGGDMIATTETVQQQASVHHGLRKSSSEDRADEYGIERRCSHEENSDSSKDNSLQSDTSIDSEDSIISVIERVIPKSDTSTSPTLLTSPGPHSPKMALTGILSHPSSPKISQIMQYPNSKGKALSLPASPRTLVLSPSIKQTFKIPPVAQISSNGNSQVTITPNGKVVPNGSNNGGMLPSFLRETNGSPGKPLPFSDDEPVLKLSSMKQVTAARLKPFGDKEMLLLSQKLTKLSSKETEPRAADICEGNDDSHKLDTESLTSPKETLKKADLISRAKGKPPLAVVKRLGHQKSLQNYELFNPEMEDIDTDSSGVSTPDSVGSVISVKMESLNGTPQTEIAHELSVGKPSAELQSQECSISSLPSSLTRSHSSTEKESADKSTSSSRQGSQEKRDSLKRASSTSTSRSDSKELPDNKTLKKYPSLSKSPENETWDRQCRQYIVDLAENLSERLLAEICRYKESNINIERELCTYSDSDVDPYLTKLSEELSHVSKLTKELSVDLETKTTTDTVQFVETEIHSTDSLEEISDVVLDDKRKSVTGRDLSDVEENIQEERDDSPDCPDKDTKKMMDFVSSDQSTEAESPGSISGWLDSRRNTIESGYWKDQASLTVGEEGRRSSISTIPYESARKLSTSDTQSHTRLSIESTETIDVSERTVSSSEDSTSKRDTTQTETSSGLSAESDFCDLDKSADTSKSTEYSGTSGLTRGSSIKQGSLKYSASQASLRPGESIESSDTGDISDRTGSVSDFSRQNTESRSVITQSSASLASWSDCSKDIRFADRRTARCDGRSSSEETNPRAVLTRQVAATEAPSEVKMSSASTSLSNSTSQDSLTSESAGGGSIMFHRYYHVFREGELDELIEEFVENLHIISSYYDHTNWCIIAEKVRVWTI